MGDIDTKGGMLDYVQTSKLKWQKYLWVGELQGSYVGYFDQYLGTVHSKCWSKFVQMFM